MSKKSKNNSEENRLHKEYGVFSNIFYITKKMNESQPRLKFIIAGAAFINPVLRYLWTYISKFVIDMVTGNAEIKKLVYVMTGLFLVQILATIFDSFIQSQNWWRYISARFSMLSEKNKKCMTMKFEYLEDSDVMDCYQKAGNAANNNNQGVEGMMHCIEHFLANLLTVVIGIIIMGTMNWVIILLMTAVAVINFLVKKRTSRVAKKKVWDPLAPWWRKNYYMGQMISDFKAAKDIRLFGLKDFMIFKWQELNKTRVEAEKTNQRLWFVTGQISNVLWLLSQGALYGWLVYSVINKDLSLGDFTLYLGAAGTFFSYLDSLLDVSNDIIARSREVDDWRSFMDIDDGGDTDVCVPAYDKYEFTFENVSFKYPKADNYALKNLNLTVKAGERLAVVGLNGAGKSTFIKLLLRLYEPTEGRILLNGVDVKTYNRKSYYDVFAAVFQDVNLFAFPLSENVSMQTPEETDVEFAEKCVKDAGLGNKISELSAGMQTQLLKVIYDDGVDLSGGEKQKLALARALYKKAPVVVLDEPTAALDALAEAKLYQDFDKLIGGKTAVYISHRLSSTQFCSNVAMFKDGEMVEYGTHESLMNLNGEYAHMFEVQAQYYVEGGEEGEKEEQ